MAQAAQHGKLQVGHAHALPPLTGLPECGKDQLQTTASFPNRGIVLVQRRCSAKARSIKLVVRIRL